MGRTVGSVQQIEASPEDVGLASEGLARLTRHISRRTSRAASSLVPSQ